MQTFLQTETFVIVYDQTNHLLILRWLASPMSEEFREGTNDLITALEHFKTGKVITDISELGAILDDDQLWLATHWRPQALKAGLSHSAVILSQDIFTQLSFQSMLERANTSSPIRKDFSNMEDAMEWIQQF
jgi:hypothetical protein